jgi:hypothetical protein
MEVLPALRLLWRRRRLLVAGALVAVAIGIAFGRPQTTSSALARTRVALDTTTSQLVASAPNGADTLPWRASLLMHLMATDATQGQLAQRLGVARDQVAVVDVHFSVPEIPASMPQVAADAANITVAPYVLTVYRLNAALPVISIDAAAPDRAGAKRLAAAAVAVLKSQASPGGRYRSRIETDAGSPKTLQPFVVDQVASVRVELVAGSTLSTKALGAAFLFFVWTACLAFVPRPTRHRRDALATTGG